MSPRRKILIILVVGGVVGPLLATAGVGLWLRSDAYRESLEQRISRYLLMDVSIGSAKPLTLRSRRLADVGVRSPKQNEDVFECKHVDWRAVQHQGETAYELLLREGWLTVGAHQWARSDYDEILRKSLGHDFAALRLQRIQLDDIALRWKHPRAILRAEGTSGEIVFDNDGMGHAALAADRLNGVDVDPDVRITARFTPGEDTRFHEISLDIPDAPLNALGVDAFVGGVVTRGQFRGEVRYRHGMQGQTARVSGAVLGASLSELTAAQPAGPFTGEVDVVVDEAVFSETELTSLRFSGQLNGLQIQQLAPILPGLTGNVDLRIHQAHFRNGSIEYFSGEGSAKNVSLDAIASRFTTGKLAGQMEIVIHALLIVEEQLVFADATVNVRPREGETGTIDRSVLSDLSNRMLGMDATALLPPGVEQIEYRRLGARFELNRNTLRIHGTHGPDDRTILTVHLFDRDFAMLTEPSTEIPVRDMLAWARDRLNRYDFERLRNLLLSSDAQRERPDDN